MRTVSPRALVCAFLVLAGISRAEPLLLGSRTVHPAPSDRVSLSALLSSPETRSAGGRHLLVQLRAIPDEAGRRAIADRGLVLLQYVPVRGYLAWARSGAEADPAVLEQLEWVGPLLPDDRCDDRVRRGDVPTYALAPDGRARVLVLRFPDAPQEVVRAALERSGAEVVAEVPLLQSFRLRVTPSRVRGLAEIDGVRWVGFTPPPSRDASDGMRVDQTVDVLQALPYGLAGDGVKIGQLESRNPVQTHPDIAGRITKLESIGTSKHATHVAGLAIGDGTRSASQGGAPFQWRGVATGAEIVSWKGGEIEASYLVDYDAAINLFDVDMTTNSWHWDVAAANNNCSVYGDYGAESPGHDGVVTGTYGRRIPIFCAAGNERDNCDCGMSCGGFFLNYGNLSPPCGTAKNTMTIGAKPSDGNDVCQFSAWGPTDDGRLKPEIVASGCEDSGGAIMAPWPPAHYFDLAGTSMSTPATAGSAALFLEDFRTLTGSDPLPSTYKAHFVHTAEDLDDPVLPYLNAGPDYASGYGSLKVVAAIEQLRSGNWVEGSVDQGEVAVHALVVPAEASKVVITLAWDDEPGALNAGPALVNDLDLVVTDPLAMRRYPWTLDPANPQVAAVRTAEDHLNPLEKVEAKGADIHGAWVVEVRGTAVPFGPQPYSLVFSHNGTSIVDAPVADSPADLRLVTLHGSHPNPFRPWTSLSYTLHRAETVTLRVLDVRGRPLRTLVSARRQGAGEYTYAWRGRDDEGRALPSGVYFVELRAGSVRETQKVTLIR